MSDALAAAQASIVAVGLAPGSDLDLGRPGEPAWAERAGAVVAALGRSPEPADLGAVYEALLAPAARDAGAHFTAPDVARRLVDRAAPSAWLAAAPRRVWDPACGGGAFLLAAADALAAAGHDPGVVVRDLLWGTDVDPGAVTVCRAALRWWAERRGIDATVGDHVRVGDTLLDPEASVGAPFDLVVGNPPFQGQLAGSTVRERAAAAALQARWGDVVAAYTDTAAVFLVAGARSMAPDGRMTLVLPLSMLAARDAAPARRAVEEVADLTGLWVAGELVFDAEVDVCAPVFRRPAEQGPLDVDQDAVSRSVVHVERWRGREVAPVGSLARGAAHGTAVSELTAAEAPSGSWAVHALAALDVPDPRIRTAGRLGSLVRTAAGFRDEYYGLVGHVAEGPDGVHPDDRAWPEHLVALVTSGAIDVGGLTWGLRATRFAGERFLRPVVDRRSLPSGGRASAWAAATALPKVVVATQTRVGEAVVDARGTLLPSTPVVVAFAAPDRLWDVAAVICSPVGSVAALARVAGTGRSAQAIRHTTGGLKDLPLPVGADAWQTGAAALRDRDRDGFVAAMAEAYEVGPSDAAPLADWWTARAPWPTPP